MDRETKKRSVIIKRLLGLFKPYTPKIVLVLMCILVVSGISFIIPLLSKQIMDNGLLKQNYHIVLKFSLITIGLVMVEQVLSLVEARQLAYINSKMTYDLSKEAYKHLIKLKVDYFHRVNSAEIINNIVVDSENIARISDRSTFFLLSMVFKIIGGVTGLILISPTLALVVICIVPIKYKLVKFLAKNRTDVVEKYICSGSNYIAWFGDSVSGIKEIKLFGLNRVKLGQFIKLQREVLDSKIKLFVMDRLNEISESVLMQISISSLYLLGASMIFEKNLTVGGFLAFITYSTYITGPVSAVLNIGYSFTNVLPSAERLFEFLDEECEFDQDSVPIASIKKEFVGNISFENVTFSYVEGQPVLNNVNFSIKKGDKVAIIGPNGSGKTTVINLLLRFYKPNNGRILIDGVAINRINLRDYRKLFSIVSQEIHLFDTTIKNNISLHQRKTDVEIYDAASLSQVNDFINILPDKYENQVGQNGSKLSGGQRQKIAMARALVKGFDILILDEATSNYDLSSELQLEHLLGSDFQDKTIIVITHRHEILKSMNKVILLNEGRVVDTGNHEELYLKNPLYREMIKKSYETRQIVG